MITGLHGVLRDRGTDHVIVGVGGFDVRAFVSTMTLSQAGQVGEAINLFTFLYLREEVLALYGFASKEELALFELLITVSGVGPRLALTLLSTLTPEALAGAIERQDAVALSRAPGVGRKLAGRLILELKDKFSTVEHTPAAATSALDDDVIAALMVMGLTAAEAHQAAQGPSVRDAPTTNEKVTRALQAYAAGRR